MIVGVDIGTQSLKVVVTSESLEVLGRGSRSYSHVIPRDGWAEQDPQVWLDAIGPAIADALRAADAMPSDVTAVGLAGQLDGCIPTGDDGQGLGPCLLWMDKRATDSIAPFPPGELLEMTGQIADPSHMAPKIGWLKAHGSEAVRFHQPVSFVLEALCGEAVFDPGHASTTMLFDQLAEEYSSQLLDAYGISRDELPRIAAAESMAGQLTSSGAALTGLTVGTPICVGTGDDFATPLGAGIDGPGTLACVLGTAEVVGTVSMTRVLDRSLLVETHNFVGGRYFVENPGWLCGASVAWASRVLGAADAAAFDRLASGAAPGSGGVSFVPALAGAMAPRWRSNARACFYGMNASTTSAELARSVLEGCAFAMHDVALALDSIGLGCSAITLLGGGSASVLWSQIRADVSGLPVAVMDEPNCSAVGAALLAGVASGIFSGHAEGSRQLSKPTNRADPAADCQADTSEYTVAYARYRALFDRLDPFF